MFPHGELQIENSVLRAIMQDASAIRCVCHTLLVLPIDLALHPPHPVYITALLGSKQEVTIF